MCTVTLYSVNIPLGGFEHFKAQVYLSPMSDWSREIFLITRKNSLSTEWLNTDFD